MKPLLIGPLAAVLLASCASLPRDRGTGDVSKLLTDRGAPAIPLTTDEVDAATADARARLAEPLTLDDAVALALVLGGEANRERAQLGLAYADLAEASRPANPGITLSAQRSNDAGERTRYGFGIVQQIGDLLLLRSRSAIARGEFGSAQESAARALQEIVSDTAKRYFDVVAATQVAQMRTLAATAARMSADLAARYVEAGNLSKLDGARHEAEAVDAELRAEEARSKAETERHELAVAIGLSANDVFRIEDTFALPVDEEDSLDTLSTLAAESRLDLSASRRRAEVLAQSLGVTRRFRWLGSLEVGVEAEREPDGERLVGPTVSFELPIFHRNQATVARAEARVAEAEAEAHALERAAALEVRSAWLEVASAKRRVEAHRAALLPLREQIVAEMQGRVNFMLDSPFELIDAKRREYDAYESYLESLADYWRARVSLAAATGHALPSDARIAAGEPQRATILPPPADDAADEHGHHTP